ncbi:hypothetical protein TI05_08885 [Achromatium sp. WMS3]|nr:hypothetical protein TI05_08885 [Achromatium sp. WMS3]
MTNTTKTDLTSKKLARLAIIRANYLKSLPNKINEIESLWTNCKADYTIQNLQALHMSVHKLNGSSGSYGLHKISTAASQLESLLIQTIKTTEYETPSSNEIELLNKAVANLITAPRTVTDIENALPQIAKPKLQDVTGTIYLLEDDLDQATLLTTQLTAHGYQISHFETVNGLREACALQAPGAIIADIMLPEGEHAGIEAITAIHADLHQPPPVLFVSALKDSKTRLAALRAGGRGYFSKPLDYTRLLLQLEDFLRPNYEERRVLIVDADQDFITLSEKIVQDANFVVRSITDPMTVVDVMYEFQPHVVVIDMLMPEVNGLELAGLLRQETQFIQTPIIFVTVDKEASQQLLTFENAQYDLIDKSVDMDKFQILLKKRVSEFEHRLKMQQFLLRVDPATGFYQPEYFSQYIDAILQTHEDRKVIYWLAGIKLQVSGDRYKTWNNRHNRAVFGSEIRSASTAIDKAIIGASEFWECLLFFQAPQAIQATKNCQQIRNQLLTKLKLRLPEINPEKCGVGLVRWDGKKTVSQMSHQAVSLASLAQQEATGMRINDPAAMQNIMEQDKAYWQRELKQCIEEKRLFILFQPIIANIRDNIEYYEILLRLQSSDHKKVLLPESFIIQADIRGMLPFINRWVIANALFRIDRQIRKGRFIKLFVHMSRHTIGNKHFVNWLKNYLQKNYRSLGRHYSSECVLMYQQSDLQRDLETSLTILKELQQLGFQIMLNNFQGDTKAWQTVEQSFVDIVKLTPNFTLNICKNPSVAANLISTVERLHAIKIKVMVGFIEDAESFKLLFKHNIDLLQGFFLAHPEKQMNVIEPSINDLLGDTKSEIIPE